MSDRAAQFMPFRALSGYEDAVREAARPVDRRAELTEDEKALLDARLRRLADAGHPQVTLTYFLPDPRKTGGAYLTVSGRLKRVDDIGGALILAGGERIPLEDILEIRQDRPSEESRER